MSHAPRYSADSVVYTAEIHAARLADGDPYSIEIERRRGDDAPPLFSGSTPTGSTILDNAIRERVPGALAVAYAAHVAGLATVDSGDELPAEGVVTIDTGLFEVAAGHHGRLDLADLFSFLVDADGYASLGGVLFELAMAPADWDFSKVETSPAVEKLADALDVWELSEDPVDRVLIDVAGRMAETCDEHSVPVSSVRIDWERRHAYFSVPYNNLAFDPLLRLMQSADWPAGVHIADAGGDLSGDATDNPVPQFAGGETWFCVSALMHNPGVTR